ncbi:MAG: hypothetical protein JWL77_6940, partial [Chthonomonadaceae bacterium]|nr:hypothetical protein [Chthonomonadaceae bacterium]
DAFIRELSLDRIRPIAPSEDLAAAFEERGVEALAWYCSPSLHPVSESGIWIREQGLHLVAQGLTVHSASVGQEFSAGFLVILAHELFHAVVDDTVTSFDLWLTTRSGAPERVYDAYANQPVVQAAGEPLEEALANAFALRQASQCRLAVPVDVVRHWMNGQPSGYRDYARYDGEGPFDAGLRALGGRAATATAASTATATNGTLALERALKAHAAALRPFDVPTYYIADLEDPVAAGLPPADAPRGIADELARKVQSLPALYLDGDTMARTETGRASLRELARVGHNVADRLRPHLERSRRAERVQDLGLRVQNWPSGSPLGLSGEGPARVAAALGKAVAALDKQAETAFDHLRWGERQPVEAVVWDKDRHLERLAAISAIGQVADDLGAAAAAVGRYAVRLW